MLDEVDAALLNLAGGNEGDEYQKGEASQSTDEPSANSHRKSFPQCRSAAMSQCLAAAAVTSVNSLAA
jgi:hypothetical protein